MIFQISKREQGKKYSLVKNFINKADAKLLAFKLNSENRHCYYLKIVKNGQVSFNVNQEN